MGEGGGGGGRGYVKGWEVVGRGWGVSKSSEGTCHSVPVHVEVWELTSKVDSTAFSVKI